MVILFGYFMPGVQQNMDSRCCVILFSLTIHCSGYILTVKHITAEAGLMLAQREDFYGFHTFGNRDIQMVLREIDSEELAISLVGADNETISAIKRNMSENAIFQLDRDIAAGERVPREKITAARDSITAIIKRLKQEGVILLQQ